MSTSRVVIRFTFVLVHPPIRVGGPAACAIVVAAASVMIAVKRYPGRNADIVDAHSVRRSAYISSSRSSPSILEVANLAEIGIVTGATGLDPCDIQSVAHVTASDE